jgi:integrase
MNGSIRRRGEKSWELNIDLGRDATGQRRRKFVNVKGSKAHAQQRLRELLTSLDKGLPIDSKKITLTDWMARWMTEYVRPKCRQMTIERYDRAIQRHILPALGHIELGGLTPGHIQSLEAKLAREGMAPAGVELIHNVLSGALKYAVRLEVVWRNVIQAVTPPRVVRKEVEPPEITAVRRILDSAKAEDHPLHPCLHLMAYTGIRRGEALGLRWRDLDLDAGTISVVQALARSVEKGLIFQPPKTNSGRRVIDLDDSTVAVLRAHQGQQLLYRSQLEAVYQNQDLLFPDPTGGPLNPMALTRAFKRLAQRVGVKDGRLHNLRHFHASVMLQSGQSLVLVSKRLGHASVSTTADIYAHIAGGWQKEAARAFAKAMEGGA